MFDKALNTHLLVAGKNWVNNEAPSFKSSLFNDDRQFSVSNWNRWFYIKSSAILGKTGSKGTGLKLSTPCLSFLLSVELISLFNT